MAYSDDILALGADHLWTFDGNSNDSIGVVNGTDTGVVYTQPALAVDATNCMTTNGTTDRVTIPDTADINNSAQTRKVVAGWFATTAIQTPPKRIYGEGNATTTFQFVMVYGNNVMFECVEPTNFTLQVFSDRVLQPNRAYHLCGIFEGNGFNNEIRFYLDGSRQTLTEPDPAAPGTADLNSRTPVEFGDPVGTVGIGAEAILLNASVNGQYSYWATWDGAALDDAEVFNLFELGAIPGFTVTGAASEATMQTTLDTIASTSRGDEPLNIQVQPLSGGGDLTLTATNIVHDPLASIHVQYTGTDTLTWINAGTSNASISSTPQGGTVTFVTQQTLTVTVLDVDDSSAIENARVYITAAAGGPLAEGTVIMNQLTNASGVATASFNYSADQPFTGRVRKGSSSTYYRTGALGGTLTSTPLDTTTLLAKDE